MEITTTFINGRNRIMSWKKMPLPEEGMYLGSGIYIIRKDGFYLDNGAFSTWNPQDFSPKEHLDLIKKDNQGNVAQIWGWWGPTFYAMEDIGVTFKDADWENKKNLKGEENPDLNDYADRMGAGLIKFIEQAREMGIYTTGLYSSELAPEWSHKLEGLEPWWLGYDFGERYSFHLNRGSNDGDAHSAKRMEDATLEDFANGLLERVNEHVSERKSKGWGRVMATSGSFHLDYEIIGGTDIPVQEDFAFRHLTFSSALGRGLFRQFRLPVWGSHIAHEHYSWIPYASPYKFPLLAASFYLKYMNGCKLIINESGNWYTQVKLCPDSPMYQLPYGTIGKNGDPTAPESADPYDYAYLVPEARKKYPMIDYRSPTAVRYRKTISDFWDFVKVNGTPAGQPETTIAIAKGNLDLSAMYCAAGNYAVASAYTLADINHDWYEGDPERSWKLIEKVFCPCPPVIPPYKNQYLSATPHGLFDIVTFAMDKIDADFLIRNYKALIFAGWNTCTEHQYEVLKKYVAAGGILCISIPHLSTNKTRNYRSYDVSELIHGGDVSELCGVKVKQRGRRIYWATGNTAEPNELGVKVPRRFGILATPIGELEITDPAVRVVIADDEQFDPVVLHRKCGKGEVFFVNTWSYPGALDIDDGPGSYEGANGLMEPVWKYIAKRARGNVYITDDGSEPGEECKYINCTYFPDDGRICLYNIDFDHSHKIVLHQFGYQETIELEAAEFLSLDSVTLLPHEKLNEE